MTRAFCLLPSLVAEEIAPTLIPASSLVCISPHSAATYERCCQATAALGPLSLAGLSVGSLDSHLGDTWFLPGAQEITLA